MDILFEIDCIKNDYANGLVLNYVCFKKDICLVGQKKSF